MSYTPLALRKLRWPPRPVRLLVGGVTASITKITAGSGYEYLTRQVARMDATSEAGPGLAAYYSEKGEAPGRWVGTGLTGMGGLAAGDEVYAHLPDIKNNADLFGNQLIMRDGDQPAGTVEKLLINATTMSIDEVCALARRYSGIAVPAHINRGSNGMIGALGLMPPLPDYPVVEVSRALDCPAYAAKGRFLLHSSDAHRLDAIQERVEKLELSAGSAQAVLERLIAQ